MIDNRYALAEGHPFIYKLHKREDGTELNKFSVRITPDVGGGISFLDAIEEAEKLKNAYNTTYAVGFNPELIEKLVKALEIAKQQMRAYILRHGGDPDLLVGYTNQEAMAFVENAYTQAAFKNRYRPQFYYEWGNEPTGYVSVGLYIDDEFYSCGQVLKTEVIEAGLPYHSPHN